MNRPKLDNTERFSDRVEAYRRFRPDYPAGVIDLLRQVCQLGPGRQVADIGAGTGIFSNQLLQTGCQVVAVEPNGPMRLAAQQWLGEHPGFAAVNGTAEATSLGAASVDVITAAQSFHWCDPLLAQREFTRILRPGGWVALIWNQRRVDEPFQQAYDELLYRYATDYASVNHRNIGAEVVKEFFSPCSCQSSRFEHAQWLDRDSLRGRLQSSSYCPREGTEGYAPLMQALDPLFDRYAQDGQVAFRYQTLVYYGQLE